MNEELFNQEENFQKYLREKDYTFIGPADANLLNEFMKRANLIAPLVGFSRSIHHALSNRSATRSALQYLPANSELRTYVIIRLDDQFLFHATTEEYCKRFDINYLE